MFNLRLVGLMTISFTFAAPLAGLADDDEGNPSIPPVNPGNGYEQIFPNPTLPPNYVPHTGSSPSGVGSIANTQTDSIRLGQTFQATAADLDWVAMVFQYNYQPSTGAMDPALFRIHVASGIVTSGNNSGELVNVLGSTEIRTVTPDPVTGDSLGWILFDFPSTVSLTPGNEYYLRVEHVGGYGVDNTGVGVAVGSLGSNAYAGGDRWRAIYNSFLDRWEQFAFHNEDLVFSMGTTKLFGDFNGDDIVNAADFTVWRNNLGDTDEADLHNHGDGGGVTASDYTWWKEHYGNSISMPGGGQSQNEVPEPAAPLTFLLPSLTLLSSRKRR
jgi:hypothetical protein